MDTLDLLDLLKDVAAEVITPRFRALSSGDIMEKRPGDLVTVADHEAEERISDALRADDPDVLVVGEEASATDPALLERLVGAEHAFTVDPVDGTKNFVNGSPNHAVMVSEIRRDEVVRAWIWQPEHQVAYVVERGAGAFRNGERLDRRSPGPELSELRVLTSRPEWEGLRGGVELRPSAWCCGVDYPWLAEGTVDALLYSRALPWDHAPGSLFVQETGGVVRAGDGSAFRPTQVGRNDILAAAGEEIWRHLSARLAPLPR